jgi:hypothetical protein
MAELITERLWLTGDRSMPLPESFVSWDMKWGTEHEGDAKIAYQVETGLLVTEVGAIDHPTIPWTAASPDGVLDDPEGLLEIKCPQTKTHLSYLRAGIPPADYVKQMGWQIACSGRKWVDFCSFDPRLPEDLQLFVVRFEPDAKLITALQDAVITFLEELDQQMSEIAAWRTKQNSR